MAANQPSPISAKPNTDRAAAIVAEMSAMELRIERRLEHLSRTEANLKGLFESIRQQVAAAYPVIDQLNKAMPTAQQQLGMMLDTARKQIKTDIDSCTRAALESADRGKLVDLHDNTDQIMEMIDARIRQSTEQYTELAKTELAGNADLIRQSMIDELQTAVEASKSALTNFKPKLAAHDEAQMMLADLADAFKADAKQVLADSRRQLIEQIEILQTDVQLKIDPMIAQLEHNRDSSDAQARAIVSSADRAIQMRIMQLRSSADEMTQVMEDRLAQRVMAMGTRAQESAENIENQLRQRLQREMESIHSAVDCEEDSIKQRISNMRPVIQDQLTEIERDYAIKIQRFEDHAASMTNWLEKKLIDRVDDLIARMRINLQSEINRTSNLTPPTPPKPPTTSAAMPKPTVEVDLYVNNTRTNRPTAA